MDLDTLDHVLLAKVAERFTTAMKAWMPVAAYLTSHGYDYAAYEEDTAMRVTCKECDAGCDYDGVDLDLEHEVGCRLAEAEQGLETLRKMAAQHC